MPKIVYTGSARKEVSILGSHIPSGTVFLGKVSSYPNRLFFKSYEAIVALDGDGDDEWGNAATWRDYQPVEVTITVAAVQPD